MKRIHKFNTGDIVRQYHSGRLLGWYDDAIVTNAHPNGALDVASLDGKSKWGWSSSRVELVGFLA